jgi:hypothetical protein
VSVRRRLKIRSVLRHGIRVSCLSPASGRCTAVARRGRRPIARGSAQTTAGKASVFRIKATPAGRRALRAASRRHRQVRLTVTVRLPGAKVSRRLLLVP